MTARGVHDAVAGLMIPDPQVSIGLDEKMREGIAAQLRLLADLLDPPKKGNP
jgi:hypothetical protein